MSWRRQPSTTSTAATASPGKGEAEGGVYCTYPFLSCFGGMSVLTWSRGGRRGRKKGHGNTVPLSLSSSSSSFPFLSVSITATRKRSDLFSFLLYLILIYFPGTYG